MRVVLASYGSTGDIFPMLAIGAELVRRGHAVSFAAPAAFAREIEAAGIARVEVPPQIGQEEVAYWMNRLQHQPTALQQIMLIFRSFRPHLAGWVAGMREAIREADVVIGMFLLPFLRPMCAEAGVPYLSVAFAPGIIPDGDTPPGGVLPWTHVPAVLRRPFCRTAWALGDRVVSAVFRREIGAALRQAGGPRVPRFFSQQADRVLAAFSPSLFPIGDPRVDVRIVGYCRWQPRAAAAGIDADLAAWMAPGVPVVAFGSMVYDDPQAWMHRLARAWPRERRLVVQSGWARFAPVAEAPWIRVVPPMPQDGLFAAASVVVHHGGAGTTATALHAGRPQVVVPHIAEQPYWAERVRALGCGGRLRRAVWPERLAAAVDRVADAPACRDAARSVAARLAAENGPVRAADEIEAFVRGRGVGLMPLSP